MANGNSFVADLSRHIGQTVTIFTTSGGQSGLGFTGVLVSVNCNFVRLITQIGPAPGCALGNCCGNRDNIGNVGGIGNDCENNGGYPGIENNELALPGINPGAVQGVQGGYPSDQGTNLGGQGRATCNLRNGLGSIVDIPVNRIASFVHNAVGSGW